jgi:hypothetical protein
MTESVTAPTVRRESGYYWVRRYYIVEKYTGEPMVGFFDGECWLFVDTAAEWLDDERITVLSGPLVPPEVTSAP